MSPKEFLPAPPEDPIDTARAEKAQRFSAYTAALFGIASVLLVLVFSFNTPMALRVVVAVAMLLSGLLLMFSLMLTMSLRAERKRAQKAAQTPRT